MPTESIQPSAAVAETAERATFDRLGLQAALVRAAAAAGWAVASPIQAAAIPAILSGRDVLAQAPTGSGKTAAFLLPVLQLLLDALNAPDGLDAHGESPQPLRSNDERQRPLRALVLAPTRELAVQIGAAAQALAPALKTVVAVGGLSINPQMMALRGGAHLLVATPGRLLDLTRSNAVHLRDLQWLVLDEADRLLDPGFAEETQRVLALAPRQRQTLLFSATMPDAVKALAARVQRDAFVVRASEGWVADDPLAGSGSAAAAIAPAIRQRAIVVDGARRVALLRHLLREQRWPRTLVFVATQYASEHVAAKLQRAGVTAAALHGQLSQGRRGDVLDDLKAGRLSVLVATDLASRGLDIAALDAVVNFDLPRSADDHTHRIGRTGRAGAAGAAISFICADAPGSEAHFRLIEKRQQQRVARERLAGFEPVFGAESAAAVADESDESIAPSAPSTGGIKGRRKSKKDKLREAAARLA